MNDKNQEEIKKVVDNVKNKVSEISDKINENEDVKKIIADVKDKAGEIGNKINENEDVKKIVNDVKDKADKFGDKKSLIGKILIAVILLILFNIFTEPSATPIPGTSVRIITSSIKMTDEGLKAKILDKDDKKYTIIFLKGNNGKMDLSSSVMYRLYDGWDNLDNPATGLRNPTMTKILEFMKANQ